MNKIIKKGISVVRTYIYNRTGEDQESECELTFSDGSMLTYEIDEVDELYEDNIGIYELNEDDSYTQIEDWE